MLVNPSVDKNRPWLFGVVRFLLCFLGTILVLVGLACGVWWSARKITERKRTQWKGPALERLATFSMSNEVVRLELQALKPIAVTNNSGPTWTGQHLLLMTNGEYIVYEYRHGRNDYFPPHLFLGRCSDGRWLYSSYHFCNSMAMVMAEDPPGSIAEFARKYFAREFDGKSDECLKLTQ